MLVVLFGSLWTSGDYNLTYTLAQAQRFSKKGYSIYLDMHFSDTWADTTSQAVPSGWDKTSLTTLSASLRSYVSTTLKAFTAKGIKITILSLGNEITSGMLFPLGQIKSGDYSGFSTLWAAARAGVNDAVSAGTTKPKIMIHLDNGWYQSKVTAFFKGVFASGKVSTSDVDVFGFSYYPFYSTSATISALTSSLTAMANTYGKPIYIAETDYPNDCPGVTLSASYPVSAAGQTQWTKAVISVLNGLPNGLGAGIYYWEPGYIKVAGLGSSCASALLFSVDWSNWPNTKATALSSVNMFK